MAGRQAKILSDHQVRRLLIYVGATRSPARNRVMILLSVKAGLRAGEIARLTWDMLLDPCSEIATVIELYDNAAKRSSGRLIPMHPDLRAALVAWKCRTDCHGPVIKSERGGPMAAVSIVNWFATAYRRLHLEGCSSHSGRRTFVTRAARLVHQAGGSLRDVQLLAGHRSILTTQRYIDGDSDAQRRLVSLL
jgi:integrase/recombinase XerD